MTNHAEIMLKRGCPDCRGDIELYDSHLNGIQGRYRCKKCSRDTFWKVGKSTSFSNVLKKMKSKAAETQDGKPGS
jgi:transposase-like protein